MRLRPSPWSACGAAVEISLPFTKHLPSFLLFITPPPLLYSTVLPHPGTVGVPAIGLSRNTPPPPPNFSSYSPLYSLLSPLPPFLHSFSHPSLTVILFVCQLLFNFSADLVQLCIIDVVPATKTVHCPIVQLNGYKQRGKESISLS